MSKPMGSIGAWAADVEREEEEAAAAAAAAASSESAQSFPSLKEAVSAKPKKKKMSLTEFYSETSRVGGTRLTESKGLTPDEMLRLPTGPKERSAEEMQYGRGFSSYGRSGPPQGRMREESRDGSWGGGRRQYGGFDEERRGPQTSRASDFSMPSRADEVDNWAMGKKPLASFDSGRPGRYGSISGGGGGGGFGGGSRADEVDNWAVGKKPIAPPMRSPGFGSGFRDHSGPDPDRWTRGVAGGDREPVRDRPRLVLDPPRGDLVAGGKESVRTNKPSPFGAARPREEVLAEKGLDWKKLEMEIEAKKTSSHSSRPTSAHSSRPSSAQSSRSEGPRGQLREGAVENVAIKPRPKMNPFGDAKPREVLLEERGQDWRKIELELEHRSIDRPETEEEKILKEEIRHLKEEIKKEFDLEGGSGSVDGSGGDHLQETILRKERELEILIRDLDDKVRFGLKAVERPGSGAGRASGFPERPPSQSGSFDEARSVEFMDRPRSRGTKEISTRLSDDRRAFHGSRERGFLGNRDFERQRSRERW